MGLRDILARYFQLGSEPATPLKGEIGLASESAIYSSKDFTRWNPDLLLSYKGVQVYDRMLTDDQVKAVLEFKIGAVVSREYYFDCETNEETGEKDQDQEKIEEFFNATISKISGNFRDKLIEILGAIKHGFTISEKIFQPIMVDGKSYWGLKDIKTRPFASFQQGFVTDKHGNLIAVKQNAGAQLIDLPLDKIIHFVHRPEIDRMYGESDLRAAYRAWWSKDIAIKFQNIHLERAAGGFIWAQIDSTKGSLDNTQKANLEKVLNTLSAQSGIHVPASVTLNHIQPLKTDAYERAVSQHDKSIAKALLVPNLLGLSEQGDVGSYSQSEVQLKVFFWILDLIASRLEETLNEQLFKQLAQLNFGTDEFPQFRFEPISDDEKERIMKTWAELVSKGAVTRTDADEAYIRQLLSFPEKSEEEENSEIPLPGQKPLNPEDQVPTEQPDNEEYLKNKPEEVRQQFQERPWLNRVNFASIESTMTANDSSLSGGLSSVCAKIKLSLDDQVVKIGGERSWGNVKPAEIIEVKIPKVLLTSIRKLLRDKFSTTLDESYTQARKELPKKQFARTGAGMDKTQTEKFLASRAMKISGILESDILEAVQNVLENAIRYDKSLKDTLLALEDDTELIRMLPKVDAAGRAVNVPARLENIARTNIADAVNQARMSLFESPELEGFVVAYEYSAILDDRTTPICEKLHGQIKKDWGSYTPPNHYQCRSLLVAVTQVDDWNGKDYRIPSTVTPQKGFA